jgi:MFS family permease
VSTPIAAESKPASSFGLTQWLILTVAAIGFLFDTYELLMTPLVLAPALSELLKVPVNHPDVTDWVGRVLWLTALCGGVFGLLGGWLIDRFGRKTVMIGSIFVYSFSPVLAGLSTDLGMLIFFRCTTFVGVCVEFVAAVTWLAELFPDKKMKELAIGWTQAFASVGGLFVTAVSVWVSYLVKEKMLPALPVGDPTNPAWRYTLMTGLLPAIPIGLLLPFVPESSVWLARRASGTLKRPSFLEIFSPGLIRTTIVGTLLSACAYAAAFGTLQVTVTQGIAGLPTLKEPAAEMGKIGKENAGIRAEQAKADSEEKKAELEKKFNSNLKAMGAINKKDIQPVREEVQFKQELGGLVGRIFLALGLTYVASRRVLLWMFQVPGLIIIPIVWFYAFFNMPDLFGWGVFFAGMMVVAQFSYFGEYLPKAFPVHLRGTGGAFATNVGGRMLGTSAALLTTSIIAPMLTSYPGQGARVAVAAGIVGVSVFAIGFLLSFFLPEAPAEEHA